MAPPIAREDYIRVTTILYPFSGLRDIDPSVVAHAAERGTKVHKICEAIASGVPPLGIEDEVWGYVESFKKWFETADPIVEMEKRFWCDDLQVTGQVDFILDTPDGLAIIDLKTSSQPSKTWMAQGSAYAYLAKKAGYDIKKVYFVHLNKHGKPPKVYDYPMDDAFFMSILRTYLHFFCQRLKHEYPR